MSGPRMLSSSDLWLAIGTAVVGLGAGLAIFVPEPVAVLQAGWLALVVWSGVSVGALFILALHAVVGGRWGMLLGPALVAMTRPLWLLAPCCAAYLLLLPQVFPWAAEGSLRVEYNEFQLDYLTPTAFAIRSGIYWALWLALSVLLTRSGSDFYEPASPLVGAPAMPLLVLAVTFSAIDWLMSLEPHWHSTAFGLVLLAGHGSAAFAIAILLAARAAGGEELDEPQQEAFTDSGNLLLTAISCWMYVVFCQFQIIWSGNLPEEASYYLRRTEGYWPAVVVVLVGLHFAIPFLLLLASFVKRTPLWLGSLAAVIVLGHLLDVWWQAAPAFGPVRPLTVGADLAALAGGGGLWLACCLWAGPQWPPELIAPAEPSPTDSQEASS